MDYPKVGEKWVNEMGYTHEIIAVDPINGWIWSKWNNIVWPFDIAYWRQRDFQKQTTSFWRKVAIFMGFLRR